jgi:hypothetical protein
MAKPIHQDPAGARIVPHGSVLPDLMFERLDAEDVREAGLKLDEAFNAAEMIALRMANGCERLRDDGDPSIRVSADLAWRLSEFAEALKVNAEALVAFGDEIANGAREIWREQEGRRPT